MQSCGCRAGDMRHTRQESPELCERCAGNSLVDVWLGEERLPATRPRGIPRHAAHATAAHASNVRVEGSPSLLLWMKESKEPPTTTS